MPLRIALHLRCEGGALSPPAFVMMLETRFQPSPNDR